MTPRGFEHLRAICKGPRLKVDFFQTEHAFWPPVLARETELSKLRKELSSARAPKCGGPWWTMVDSGTLGSGYDRQTGIDIIDRQVV